MLLVVAGIVPAIAQSNDTEQDEIVGGTSDISFRKGVPVAGNRTLNRLSGTIVAEPQLSTVFVETEVVMGFNDAVQDFDIGLGVTAAYVPKRWGFYGEYRRSYYSDWGAAGVVFRPVMEPSMVDWQLFAGPAYTTDGLGYQIGTRFAPGALDNTGSFCWLSGSLSMTSVQGCRYYCVGLSLSLSALVFLSVL